MKGQKVSALKSHNAEVLKNKVSELVESINKTWKTTEISNIKLEFEPFFTEKMEKIKKEKGRDPTVEEMFEGLDDNQIRKLRESINKWNTDISKIIHMNRQISEGNTLDEIEFWADYVQILKNIKKQVESKEVQMTLDLVKKKSNDPITNVFEKNTKTEDI